jgi:TRAP transporter TAXI family solute receptor
MKKATWYSLLIVMTATLLLFGWSPAMPAKKVVLIMGGGPAGGSLQYRLSAYAEAIRRNTDYKVALLSGPAIANTKLLGTRERDLATTTVSQALLGLKGQSPFNKPIAMKSISTEYPTAHMILIDRKLEFTKFSEIIKAKHPLKVSVGAPRQAPELTSRDVFKAYGIKFKDIENWGGKIQAVYSGQAKMLFADRTTDAFMNIDVVPYPYFVELGKNRNVTLLSLDEDIVEKMVNAPGSHYAKFVTPAGTYDWQKSDVLSVAVLTALFGLPDMPDEVAYNVAKAIKEQRDYLVNAYPQYKVLTPEVQASVGKFVPLHPGAEKYYREIGALK